MKHFISLFVAFNIVLFTTVMSASASKPTVRVEVRSGKNVSESFQDDIDNLASLIGNDLDRSGIVKVVVRGGDELATLMDEREFSEAMSSAEEQKVTGKDASADYVIMVQVTEFRKTGVRRGALREEFTGQATARVVDTERGLSLASTQTTIKDFFESNAHSISSLAEALAQQINATIKNALASKSGSPEKSKDEFTVLRVKDDGEILVSNDAQNLAVGDELTVFNREEFEDPRNPEKKLVDETLAGLIKIERVSSAGAVARSITPGANIAVLMSARKTDSVTTSVASSEIQKSSGQSHDPRKSIPRTGVRPTLTIGKFKYSNELDLSQTADRTGKPITSASAGQGSGSTAGALIGGLLKGGKPSEWAPAAAGGAVAGQILDSERRKYEHGSDPQEARMPSDQKQTAMEKESPVLREMVRLKAEKTQRFTVTEATRRDEIKAEMDHEMDGDFDQGTVAKRGGLKGAQYAAFGTILRFETNRKQTGFGIIGGREKVEMTMTLALQVVDIADGTTVISDQVTASIDTETSQVGFMGFGTASENQGALGDLMDQMAKSVVVKIVTTLWPIQIIAVNGAEQTLTINAGEMIVSAGEHLTVYSLGEEIVDPYSGAVLGNQETTMGQIKIFEVQPIFSKAHIASREKNVSLNDIRPGMICRPQHTSRETVSTPEPATPGTTAPVPDVPSAPANKPAFIF